jgi:hypothetical protein
MALRRVRDGLLVVSLAGALPGAAGATTAPSPTPARQRADARVLVRFARPSDAAPALAATGATGGDAIGAGYRVVQIPSGRTRAQTLAALRAQPGVLSAQRSSPPRAHRPTTRTSAGSGRSTTPASRRTACPPRRAPTSARSAPGTRSCRPS